MSSKATQSENPKPGLLISPSRFFYARSNPLAAFLATAVLASYLVLVLMGKGAAFEVANSSVRSLGTTLGFGQTEILAFHAERSEAMILAYIHFNQVWDSLFALIYGVMYVIWLSVLFKPYSKRATILNLLPFGQVVFDWLENFALAMLSNEYLAGGTVSSATAALASTFSIIKWVFSLLVFGVIFVGIFMRVVRAIKKRSQRQAALARSKSLSLRGSDAYEYDQAIFVETKGSLDGSIRSGGKRRGEIAYDVPALNFYEFTYEHSLFGGSGVTFVINSSDLG